MGKDGVGAKDNVKSVCKPVEGLCANVGNNGLEDTKKTSEGMERRKLTAIRKRKSSASDCPSASTSRLKVGLTRVSEKSQPAVVEIATSSNKANKLSLANLLRNSRTCPKLCQSQCPGKRLKSPETTATNNKANLVRKLGIGDFEAKKSKQSKETPAKIKGSPEKPRGNLTRQIVEKRSKARKPKKDSTVNDVGSRRQEIPIQVDDTTAEISIFTVVDTNVLLKDRATLEKVKNSVGIPSNVCAIFVIPWIVLQELDSIKSLKKDGLSNSAQSAIKYLHSNFVNCDPRIRGQTVLESSINVGIPVECNDDRILQCCLQYKMKGPNEVVLWSNDYNLNNKAIVNSVRTCTAKNILPTILGIAGISGNVQARCALDARDVKLAAESSEVLKSVIDIKEMMSNCLESVLREEMIKIYGKLWTKVIIIQPPWTLEGVFACMIKHWIAVFGYLLRNNVKRVLEDLNEILKRINKFSGRIKREDAVEFRDKCLECLLLLETRLHSYAGPIRESICQLQKLFPDVSPLGNSTDAVMMDANDDEIGPGKEHEVEVLLIFRVVWGKINEFCGLILDSFGIKHSLKYLQPESLPSQTESLNFLSRLYGDISALSNKMQRMIEEFNVQDESLKGAFWHCLTNFLPNLGFVHMKVPNGIAEDPKEFINFCSQQNNKRQIDEGLFQLKNFHAILHDALVTIRNEML